jgi:hypothetical protein
MVSAASSAPLSHEKGYNQMFSHWVSLAASSLNLLRRVTVALAVRAAAVESYQAPPATVFLQALHFQIPTECLFTESYIKKVSEKLKNSV